MLHSKPDSGFAGPGSAGRRLLVVLAVLTAVVVAVVGLFEFASASAPPKEIGYGGRMYMGVLEVTRGEATAYFGPLRRRPGVIDGKQVFATAGRPPNVVALRLPDNHFNAYRLMR